MIWGYTSTKRLRTPALDNARYINQRGVKGRKKEAKKQNKKTRLKEILIRVSNYFGIFQEIEKQVNIRSPENLWD